MCKIGGKKMAIKQVVAMNALQETAAEVIKASAAGDCS